MNILILVAHPHKGSFNHAIARTVAQVLRKNSHKVICHDLYVEKFNPVLPETEMDDRTRPSGMISKHCREIAEADGMIVVHPNWWGQPPAILKGWVDRVLRAGVAYRFDEGDGGEGVPVGLLKVKAVLIFNTSNTPAKREREVFGDPLDNLWKNCIFRFCGVKRIYRKMFGVMVTSSFLKRKAWLEEVRREINRHFPASRK